MQNRVFIAPRSSRLAGNVPAGLIIDRVPLDLRNRMAGLVARLYEQSWANFAAMFPVVWTSLGRSPGMLQHRPQVQREALSSAISDASEVSDFLDIVEMTIKALRLRDWIGGWLDFRDGVEEAFLISRFGFRLVDDDIVEAGSDAENQAVDSARAVLLADPRFADAEAKFVSALVKATSQHDTDYPEAVHAAVSALEEVARELLADEKVTLDRALDRLRETRGLDANIVELIKKLYHTRGDLAGAAHGAGAGSEHIARFTIHAAAASIVYLVGEAPRE